MKSIFREKVPAETTVKLCPKCSKINFSQFDSASTTAERGEDTTTEILSLYDVIKHQKKADCEFCGMLFEAIVLHDPFEHPAIKKHMPDDLHGKTFKTWAEGLSRIKDILNSPHPFGRGRNIVEFENNNDPEAPIREVRREDLEMAVETGVIANAATTGMTMQIASQQNDNQTRNILLGASSAGKFFGSMMSMMNFKLPVAVSVVMHNIDDVDSGLLKIAVWGYGNRVQAPLSLLSSFNLRIASDYIVDKHAEGSTLFYGKRIGHEANIKEDCLRWLSHCREHHQEFCPTPDWSTNLPLPSGPHFRLLDVTKGRVVLFNVQDEAPEYVALSYVWGDAGAEALNLRTHNVQQLSQGIFGHTKSPARTVLDAIKVTKELGIQYLWVDSLCVIQKDPNGVDLEENRSQINHMGSIFGHATIVIVAATGKDAEAGLTGVSVDRSPTPQITREVRPNINVMFPVQYDKSYGVWDTRGWTFQEKLLSKRKLVFGSEYVSFHCRRDIFREDMPAKHAGNGPPSMSLLSMPTDGNSSTVTENWDKSLLLLRSPYFQEYANLLEQYTSRDMTRSKDILNGVLGLLKVLEDMRRPDSQRIVSNDAEGYVKITQNHTLYGLPEEFLDLALLWQPPAIAGTCLTKRTGDQLPSWSWVGWEVRKDLVHDRNATRKQHFHPGVRFEEPFWVATYDDMTLKKVKATGSKAEERFRPLLLWYKCLKEPEVISHRPLHSSSHTLGTTSPSLHLTTATAQHLPRRPPPSPPGHRPPPPPPPSSAPPLPSRSLISAQQPQPPFPTQQREKLPRPPIPAKPPSVRSKSPNSQIQLVPVNCNGLGYLCGSKTAESQFLNGAAKFRAASSLSATELPHIESTIRLDNRHLVCITQVATFRLRHNRPNEGPREEILWKRDGDELVIDRKLEIVEVEILDNTDEVVGYITPTDQGKKVPTDHYDFILLSEAQYWGNEARIDVVGFPLFNVMVVEWETNKDIASRVGLGKITKSAWNLANPVLKRVILK